MPLPPPSVQPSVYTVVNNKYFNCFKVWWSLPRKFFSHLCPKKRRKKLHICSGKYFFLSSSPSLNYPYLLGPHISCMSLQCAWDMVFHHWRQSSHVTWFCAIWRHSLQDWICSVVVELGSRLLMMSSHSPSKCNASWNLFVWATSPFTQKKRSTTVSFSRFCDPFFEVTTCFKYRK